MNDLKKDLGGSTAAGGTSQATQPRYSIEVKRGEGSFFFLPWIASPHKNGRWMGVCRVGATRRSAVRAAKRYIEHDKQGGGGGEWVEA